MKFLEIEQKYRIKNPAALRRTILSLGGRKIHQGFETNELLDCGTLVRRRQGILRLRRSGGKGKLTFKGPRLAGRFKKRLEVELEVDFRSARQLFSLLGFKPVATYEKTREEYRLGRAHVTIDRLKGFGWFSEIEGPAREIQRLEKKLGFLKSDREDRTYLEMIYGVRSPWRG